MMYREDVSHIMDRRAKGIIILGIILSFLVVMIPLWQKGSTATISMKTVKAEEKIQNLEKEERALLTRMSTVEVDGIKEEVAIALADL